MTPPILTNKGVSNHLWVLKGKFGKPDHRNMAIFQLADKFTLTRTFTSRLAVCCLPVGRFLLIFHAGGSRRLISEEGASRVMKKRWEESEDTDEASIYAVPCVIPMEIYYF
jgi:hypothetical protein